MIFPESAFANKYLKGLEGIEIGGSSHNPFNLNTRNVDYTGSMETIFKLEEVRLCGKAMPVDIIASGDCLPLNDKSTDFVISSHVIEHFWDPIKALKEWERVARKYIFVICPHKDRTFDRDRPLTTVSELIKRNKGLIKAPVIDLHSHYGVFDTETFKKLCNYLKYKYQYKDKDDKVGNGFMFLIDLTK